jgi:hypothetical protein
VSIVFLCFRLNVHGWDLARATGLDERMDPTEVARLHEQALTFGNAMRGPGAFGPELEPPVDATEQAWLLACSVEIRPSAKHQRLSLCLEPVLRRRWEISYLADRSEADIRLC